MQQWEYQFLPMWTGTGTAKETMNVMNMLGEHGWEFVGCVHTDDGECAVLKRPKTI